ncbi:MAG: His-Xaa-Ser system protein HxsD [Candidatus Omnitrophota bacterium]
MNILKIKPEIYPLRVVYSCAYLFLDKAYISLDGNPQKEILVRIKAKKGNGSQRIAEEFMNELLSASLRYRIAKENKKIREYIVGSALLSVAGEAPAASVDCGCGDDESKKRHAAMNWGHVKNIRNYGGGGRGMAKKDDPLGISIPWEEKYEKKSKR